MGQEHHLAFGPFHLDDAQCRLWRGDQVLPLRPQSLALLRYLVEHAGRLVTKAELRQHVWTGTHVTDRHPRHVARSRSPTCARRPANARNSRSR